MIINAYCIPELIQEAGSKTVGVGLAVWSQAGGLFLGNHMSLPDVLVHDVALVMDIHEDQYIGYQMSLFDDLALLFAKVGSNGALIAEGDELNEVVEPLTHGGAWFTLLLSSGFRRYLSR